jgi:hypothetical protein
MTGVLVTTVAAGETKDVFPLREASQFSMNDNSVSVMIPIPEHQIRQTQKGDEVSVPHFGYLLVPGKPQLPSRIFAFAIPPGAELVDVTAELGQGVRLPGTYQVPPSSLPEVIGEEDPLAYAARLQEYEDNLQAVYGCDDPYPANVVEFVRTAGYRKYNLVDVRITPFVYQPQSGQLTYYPDVTVNVEYSLPETPQAAMLDNLPRTERVAREITFNYDQTPGWYPQQRTEARGLHDFVIVTIDSLVDSVQPLVTWETIKGRTVEVVTTTWINDNYTGYDVAARIRAFLRDKYPEGEWGIEDVLLVGHYDQVPMRRTWQDLGYGKPETDYYYAELSAADSASWDADGDHKYGENSDPVDFYAEVNVGRIPWSTPDTVASICQKSVAYEQNDDPAYKKNILLLGAYFWSDTDNAVLMETKVDQPWMADWTMTRMYEKNSDYYSAYPCDYPLNHSNVMGMWPYSSYSFVNWAGHGSPTSCHIYGQGAPAFISTADCNWLNDARPAIIFADACSNSDTDHLNIGQAMLKQGAVGFVGATKVALGCHAWNNPMDGSSQSLDYYFTTCVTSQDYTQGQALQWSLRQMYVYGLWSYNRYETFEWGALWGNPNLGMERFTVLNLNFPNGLPDYIEPGVGTTVSVEITPATEDYLPGSAMLHYRDDGGAFLSSPLTSVSANLFEADLPPAACGATPEYYFSAQSVGGTTVLMPWDAPASVYSATIGTLTVLLDDDAETDHGWTVEDSPDLLDGSWERGVPVDCRRGDPSSDSDGSGQCYVTGNDTDDECDSDVDEGYTRLISPTLDLSRGDTIVEYALWYTNNFLGNPNADVFTVSLSNDNGANWTAIETFGPETSSGWTHHSFRPADFITVTGQVKIRFEASDLDYASVVEAGIDDVYISQFECKDGTAVALLPEDSMGLTCGADGDCSGEARCVEGVCYVPKHRYISMVANPAQGVETARRVRLQSGTVLGWVGAPFEAGGITVAEIVAAPVYQETWPSLLHVTGCAIAPNQAYVVQTIGIGSDIGNESSYSDPLLLHTPSRWGDVVSTCPDDTCLPPQGTVNLDDIMAGITKFQGVNSAPLTWLDIDPSAGGDAPNQLVNLQDILGSVSGFQGQPYPGDGPLGCP